MKWLLAFLTVLVFATAGIITYEQTQRPRPLTAFLIVRGDSKQLVVTESDGTLKHYADAEITKAVIDDIIKVVPDKRLGVLTIAPCPEVNKVSNTCTLGEWGQKYPFLGRNTNCITISI